jgi:predicted RNA binding protein YcfA (HicA-like mRNA interferase family)
VYYLRVNSADIIKKPKAAGWSHVSTRGSHHKFTNPTTGKYVVVPHPQKDLPTGTAQNILKQAELK